MSIIAYVGIDAHEKSLTICVLPEQGNEPILRHVLSNDSLSVKKFFSRLSETHDLKCCYEASGIGYVLHRWLAELGIGCDVIAPSRTPKSPSDVIKTDKRDAFKLANLFRAGQLTSVHVPTPAEEADRALTRYRQIMVREVVQSKNCINKFLASRHIVMPFKDRWTKQHWTWLKGLEFAWPEQFIWSDMLAFLEDKVFRLTEINQRIEQLAATETYKDKASRLCSFRGIKTVTAMTLITEIGDFNRFRSAKALMSFLGLVPREHSSGESRRQGGISKTGNSRCRGALVEAAWKYASNLGPSTDLKRRRAGVDPAVVAHATKAQRRLNKKFRGMTERNKERRKAVVAVARELVGFIWAVMTDRVTPPVLPAVVDRNIKSKAVSAEPKRAGTRIGAKKPATSAAQA